MMNRFEIWKKSCGEDVAAAVFLHIVNVNINICVQLIYSDIQSRAFLVKIIFNEINFSTDNFFNRDLPKTKFYSIIHHCLKRKPY